MGLNKVLSFRALFIKRMGELLPNERNNPRAYAQIHLPIEIGGYGLGFKSELLSWLVKSPYPTQCLISKALCGADVMESIKLLRTLNKNPTRRGIPQNDVWLEKVRSFLDDYYNQVESVTFFDIKKLYAKEDFDEPRQFLVAAYRDGWMSHEDFVEFINRGNLFQELLLGRLSERIRFNTIRFVDGYRKIWNRLSDLNSGFTPPDWSKQTLKEIFNLIMSFNRPFFVNTKFVTSFDQGHWDPNDPDSETYDFFDASIVDGFRKGLPNMEVGFTSLGVNKLIPKAHLGTR
jgi:hypothetical protein